MRIAPILCTINVGLNIRLATELVGGLVSAPACPGQYISIKSILYVGVRGEITRDKRASHAFKINRMTKKNIYIYIYAFLKNLTNSYCLKKKNTTIVKTINLLNLFTCMWLHNRLYVGKLVQVLKFDTINIFQKGNVENLLLNLILLSAF